MPVWQIILLVIALLFGFLSCFLWIWNSLRAKKIRAEAIGASTNKSSIGQINQITYALGGIENITEVTASENKVKLTVVDHNKVSLAKLKKIKNRGILDQTNQITIIIGNSAQNLSITINELLSAKKAQK